MWDDLFSALALVLVIEGILPFVVPHRWREMLLQVSQLNDQTLRIFGAALMITGLIALKLINS